MNPGRSHHDPFPWNCHRLILIHFVYRPLLCTRALTTTDLDACTRALTTTDLYAFTESTTTTHGDTALLVLGALLCCTLHLLPVRCSAVPCIRLAVQFLRYFESVGVLTIVLESMLTDVRPCTRRS